MFETVCIIGLGALGGSLAAALRLYAEKTRIIGVSRAETLDAARAKHLIDTGYGYDDISAAAAQADLTVLCTPVLTIMQQLPAVAAVAPAGALITDIGSTKQQILKIAREALKGRQAYFLGGHPMAGSEQRGVHVSNAVMFRGRPWVLIDDGACPSEVRERFAALVTSFGARVVVLTGEEHDRLVAAVSHVPQLAAVALMELAGAQMDHAPALAKITGQGFADMTRIASSPFTMWRDICATNQGNIAGQLDRLIELLRQIRDRVGDEALGNNFERSNAYREQLKQRNPF